MLLVFASVLPLESFAGRWDVPRRGPIFLGGGGLEGGAGVTGVTAAVRLGADVGGRGTWTANFLVKILTPVRILSI